MFPGQILAVPHIFKFYFIEVWLSHSIVLISAVKQSDSVIHIYVHIHTHTYTHNLFHYGLSQDIECSFLDSKVGPC